MSGSIFLLQDGGRLVEMSEQEYEGEDLLQRLLAQYPNLLAGDQINSAEPRRWLLVSREVGLPDGEGNVDRWSVDHLFLDQDGIPTLVEVKRSSNTRIRREVIGQMLDYAANAVVYWPVERVRERFQEQCRDEAVDPYEKLASLLGPEADLEQFWQQVETNLQAGRIRLVFVADVIPSELRRIVEFLNDQMNPAQVLAVEVKQYVGQGMKTIIPRVLGQTEKSQQKKGGTSQERQQWDEAKFFQVVAERFGDVHVVATRRILNSLSECGFVIERSGSDYWSLNPVLSLGSLKARFVYVYIYGKNPGDVQIEVNFMRLRSIAPFGDTAKRLELLTRLNEVIARPFPTDQIDKRPTLKLMALRSDAAMARFLDILRWVVDQIKSA